MTRRNGRHSGTGDYEVGYARPPVATRFPPGRSGNPRGRPKGAKSVGQVLRAALSRRVVIHENGRAKRIRLQEAIIQGLVHDAARRNLNATKLLFALMDRYGDIGVAAINTNELEAEDRAIIAGYLAAINKAGDLNNPVSDERGALSDPES